MDGRALQCRVRAQRDRLAIGLHARRIHTAAIDQHRTARIRGQAGGFDRFAQRRGACTVQRHRPQSGGLAHRLAQGDRARARAQTQRLGAVDRAADDDVTRTGPCVHRQVLTQSHRTAQRHVAVGRAQRRCR